MHVLSLGGGSAVQYTWSPRKPDDTTTSLFPDESDLVKGSPEWYILHSRSSSTRRAYKSDWNDFVEWCTAHEKDFLPAHPLTVADYLIFRSTHGTSRAPKGLKSVSLQRRLAAIGYAHQRAGFLNPAADHTVKNALKGIKRNKGNRGQHKTAATAAVLRAMVATLPDTLLGVRDRALLLVGFAGAFRRSALVALNVEDVLFEPEGMTVIIRGDKTDQVAYGHEVTIAYGKHPETCPVKALRGWLTRARITAGPIFRPITNGGKVRLTALSDRAVARTVKNAAAAAGLDAAAFAGHSLRSGLITELARQGVTDRQIMDHTGHKDPRSLSFYIQRAIASQNSILKKLL